MVPAQPRQVTGSVVHDRTMPQHQLTADALLIDGVPVLLLQCLPFATWNPPSTPRLDDALTLSVFVYRHILRSVPMNVFQSTLRFPW